MQLRVGARECIENWWTDWGMEWRQENGCAAFIT
jgi:hypothetical protein